MRTIRVLATLIALLVPVTLTTPISAQGRANGRSVDHYDRAYRLGFTDGERDARQGRRFDADQDGRLRRSTVEFRRGYVEGYRSGFDGFRAGVRRQSRLAPYGAPVRGGYQDPAFSRGMSEGYRRGFEDGRDRDRYDPVRHGEYRDGDNGYFGGYGARDAYKNAYRDGFRRGYDEGYREGTRTRR